MLITVDIDWACEPAIEETIDFLLNHNISPTVFVTHRSPAIERLMDQIDVGLHPFFDPHSSHGSTIPEVIEHIMKLPHNLPAFRCHRFGVCNTSKQALLEVGMQISSNVCTDLEVIPPFRDRFGFLEIPIFFEDGGYLWRKHPLEMHDGLLKEGLKVILIHPLHFCLNTPEFSYMTRIKQSISRTEWINMKRQDLDRLKWKGRGIRDLIIEMIKNSRQFSCLRQHNLLLPQPERQNQTG